METSKQYNLVLVKDNCALFAPTPLFLGPGYSTVSFKLFPCYGNKFFNKIDYNAVPAKDNCVLFLSTLNFWARAMQWCHVSFFPEDPCCCHGIQPFLFKDEIGCRLTRASNAETQLLGYIAWQWDRYLVSQNIFLVIKEMIKVTLTLTKQEINDVDVLFAQMSDLSAAVHELIQKRLVKGMHFCLSTTAVNVVYMYNRKPIIQLQSVTCHVLSHSISCHPTGERLNVPCRDF